MLNSVLDDRDDLSDQIEERIVNIFYLFSQAENYVKEIIAGRMILKREYFPDSITTIRSLT